MSPSADRFVSEPFIPLMTQTQAFYKACVLYNMRHTSRVTFTMYSTVLYAIISCNDILPIANMWSLILFQ